VHYVRAAPSLRRPAPADSHSYTQQVQREGATKLSNREWYYIDYRRAIDACKYRIHKIHERVNKDAKPTTEKAELKCPQCRSQFTMMDVLDNSDPMGRASGFLCTRCRHPLDEIDEGGQADDADDTPAKFNKMFGPLLKLMEEIDQMKIPAIEGKDAVETKIDLPRDRNVDPGTKLEVVETAVSRPTAVKGLNTEREKVNVQIASTAEENEKQLAADRARQEQIAAQNQLPSWHTQSTVIKEVGGAASGIKQESNGTDLPSIKTEQADAITATQNLDLVFAQIEAERRKKEEEEDDDEEDDEDDDDEFEDVAVGTPSALPDAKRVKVESAAPTPSNAATPASGADGGDESEEDEFEDVN
jgi:transcription initiation factor TFIIE subunit alpha